MVAESNPTDRWPITQADRQRVVDCLVALATGEDAPVAIRASRLLLLLDKQNHDVDVASGRQIRDLIQREISGRRDG